MADIAQITVDNVTYDIKDNTARTATDLTSQVTRASGWNQALNPSLKKQGQLCIFTFGIVAGTAALAANAWTTIYTLPAAAWPDVIFNDYVIDNKYYNRPMAARITGDGNVQVYSENAYTAGQAQIRGSLSYFTRS